MLQELSEQVHSLNGRTSPDGNSEWQAMMQERLDKLQDSLAQGQVLHIRLTLPCRAHREEQCCSAKKLKGLC